MEELKFEIELQSPDSITEIFDFYEHLKGEVPGLKLNIKENPESKEGSMSIDILPIIDVIFKSTIAPAVVTGLFAILKDYIDLRRQKKGKVAQGKKSDSEKIILTKIGSDGTKHTIELSDFTEEEKRNFIKSFLP